MSSCDIKCRRRWKHAVLASCQYQGPADCTSREASATLQVADAGRTQVAPGSVTVLAVGGVSELVDQVSSKLNLY